MSSINFWAVWSKSNRPIHTSPHHSPTLSAAAVTRLSLTPSVLGPDVDHPRAAAASSDARMAVKPTTPASPRLSLNPTKTTTIAATRTPTAWTWNRALRIVHHASLYCLGSVVGLAVTYEGFRRLGAAGNVDLGARGRATGVIAAGALSRAALSVGAGAQWPRWRDAFFLEYVAGTVAVLVYVLDTTDLC
ncbi:hypothetical protein PR202_gb28742 [Eleusine coracana subsp. coracana]|uniref:Uncharacterized protein n=1 Tax=Eleusine coracana subsp. coracana TaxID=191504 RepID=A0AAV5FV85_ELECO|nr:hypothetical protein PR202_gb28742 [Eleusine coracana subsp. coracana]